MFGNFGIWELLLVFLVLALLFGTARLRSIGWDLGAAFKGFRNALRGDDDEKDDTGSDSGKS